MCGHPCTGAARHVCGACWDLAAEAEPTGAAGGRAVTDLDYCEVCAEHAPGPDWRVCHRCLRALEATLAGIGSAYARLDPRPGAGRGGGRGAPGFGSRSPASDDVLLLTDPRTRCTREDRWVAATVNVLGGWCEALGDARPPADVPRLVGQLRGQLDRLAAAEWAADAYAELTGHHRDLLRALGDLTPAVSIGPCPVIRVDPDDDDTPERECHGRIRAEAFGRVATCQRCGTEWKGLLQWRDLGRSLGPVELDAAELARYFGHSTPSTVRTWAWRDEWPRRRAGGRTLYPLHSALATWARLAGAA